MSKKVELKSKYVKLRQEGRVAEAREILRKIWNFSKLAKEEDNSITTIKESAVKKISKNKVSGKNSPINKVKELVDKFSSIDDLSKIKGIGKETISDLNSIYGSLNNLVSHIRSGKRLPVRNDIENKLKKSLL